MDATPLLLNDGRDGTPRWPVVVWLRVLARAVGTCAYALAARLGRSAAMATTAAGPLPSLSGHDGAAGELVPAEAARHHRSHRHSPDSSRSRSRPSPDRTPTRRSRQHRPRLATPSPHTHRTTPDTRNLAGSRQRPTTTRDRTHRQQLRRRCRSPRHGLQRDPAASWPRHPERLARDRRAHPRPPPRPPLDLNRSTSTRPQPRSRPVDQHQTPAAITTQRVAAIPNERVDQHHQRLVRAHCHRLKGPTSSERSAATKIGDRCDRH